MEEHDELKKVLENTMKVFAEGISKILRQMKDQKERVEVLERLSDKLTIDKLTIDKLRLINNIAISNEDFETCAALKTYCELKQLRL